MYNKLCRLKIKTRLFLIISIAVAGFLALSTIGLVKYHTTSSDAEYYRKLTEFTPTVGLLIHELQKERGTSALYFSKQKNSQSDISLYQQRSDTDKALKVFLAQLKTKKLNFQSGPLQKTIDLALLKLNHLRTNRQTIDDFSITAPQMLSYFTDVISNLMSIISAMAKTSDDSLITKRFIAYESFMEAKEYAGQERAIGAIGFSEQKFEGQLYNDLITLIAKQDSFFHIFSENASPTNIAISKQLLNGEVTQKHNLLREIALNSLKTGSTKNISAQKWFDVATTRIDKIKEIEDFLISELVTLYHEAENSAAQHFLFLLLGSLTASVFIFGGAYMIARSISNPLGDIMKAMHDIAAGDLKREVPHEDMDNAIGKIARALGTFKIKIVENITLEKQAQKLELKEKEKKRLELEIERTKIIQQELTESRDRAEIANKTKSEFLANMSHELRTPLNAIIGFSDIMKSGIIKTDKIEQYREYAADINDSGIHLLDIINDILDLSKVEANKVHLMESNVPLNEMIRPTLSILKHHIGRKNLSIKMDEKAISTLYLKVDERRFKQVLLNLLSNAIKFTNEQGKIEIIINPCDDKGVTLAIKDSGIGIKPEDIPKALSPFAQIDSSLNRQYEGTGLGLPLVKEFVELHDGIFDLTSEFNVGTTATIWLPANRVQQEELNSYDQIDIYPIGQTA